MDMDIFNAEHPALRPANTPYLTPVSPLADLIARDPHVQALLRAAAKLLSHRDMGTLSDGDFNELDRKVKAIADWRLTA